MRNLEVIPSTTSFFISLTRSTFVSGRLFLSSLSLMTSATKRGDENPVAINGVAFKASTAAFDTLSKAASALIGL